MPSLTSKLAVTLRAGAALLLVSACGGHGDVVFRPSVTTDFGEQVELTLLPFDIDRLVDSLEQSAMAPRPAFDELVDTLRYYTPPDPSEARDIHTLWLSVRNRVRATSDSLYRIEDRESPQYRALYQRFRDRYDDLVQQEASLERALRAVSEDHAALARRAADAADAVREWEVGVLKDLDSLVAALELKTERSSNAIQVSLQDETWAELPAGDWWMTARMPHPENPFFEYRWSGRFRVAPGLPVSVPLEDRHVTLQWRH